MDGKIESSKIGPGWAFETKAGSSGSISIKQFKENVANTFSFSDDADVPTGRYTFYGIVANFSSRKGSLYKFSSCRFRK